MTTETKRRGGFVRKAGVAAAVIAAFACGVVAARVFFSPRAMIGEAGALIPGEGQAQVWTCSMHPQIRRNAPGPCPICAMDLAPVEGTAVGAREFATSEEALALMEVETSRVERRDVAVEVRLSGKVDYDERRTSYITAWVGGRLDKLFVDFTGVVVKKGEPMALIYSPALLAAQEELLQAAKAADELQGSPSQILRETAVKTVESAREKLRLVGLDEKQIEEVESAGKAKEHVTITAADGGTVVHKNAQEGMYVKTGTKIYTVADLAHVWVKMDAYESDLAWLGEGARVEFATEAFPGTSFAGTVAFVDPVVNPVTRTVKVRVDVENPDGRLKPEMFVRGVVRGEGEAAALVIPATAALVTGKRAVVYVEVEGAQRPTFEGREVELGPRAGDFYVVRAGLSEGEVVVTKGNFKIDSALQIEGKASMMAPEGGAAATGHAGHGEGSGMKMDSGASE